MTSVSGDMNTPAKRRWSTVYASAGILFLSAFLVFSIQPLYARMALPMLGGASNVWNTAMVFFQAVLLLGYLYAHILAKWLTLPRQILTHGVIMAAAAVSLPIAIPEAIATNNEQPTIWLLTIFAVGVGAPFFALSATAPLVQHWFSRTRHSSAHDPYFLYAAANAGSITALLAYPFLIEPAMRVSTQSLYWSFGYGALLIGLLVLGVFTLRNRGQKIAPSAPVLPGARPRLRLAEIRRVILLTLVPSGLMLAVTTHITTDIASTPLLWIIPFSIYLLTYIIAFSNGASVDGQKHRFSGRTSVPIALLLALMIGLNGFVPPLLAIFMLAICFFVICLACHVEAANLRPDVRDLTQYYLWISVGGVLGGFFTAIISPLIFPSVFEFPLLIIAAALLLIDRGEAKARPRHRLLRPLVAIAILAGLGLMFVGRFDVVPVSLTSPILLTVALAATGLLAFAFRGSRHAFAVALAAFVGLDFILTGTSFDQERETLYADRSFYGVVKISRSDSSFGPVHSLQHGTTFHNHQLRTDKRQMIPLAYYHEAGSFADAINTKRQMKPKLRVATVGLGAGALACYAARGDTWTFLEIDPMIVRIARNSEYFSFVRICAPAAEIILGDARLALSKDPSLDRFDMIFVDALSSDSTAAHLVTKEAVELYNSRLSDAGLIFFHTSNRVLDVSSVAISAARAVGLEAAVWREPTKAKKGAPAMAYGDYYQPTEAVVIGSHSTIVEFVRQTPNWQVMEPTPYVGVWTDDYSHLLAAFWSKLNADDPESRPSQPGVRAFAQDQ
ncbi:MAG: fused MFS/spermidine synthase [Pseudomonadota bacterium]